MKSVKQESGLVPILKRHKWKVLIAVAVIVLATVIGLVVHKKNETPPSPGPPGPSPFEVYNPY